MSNALVLTYDPTYGYPETLASGSNIDMQGGKLVSLLPGTMTGDSLAFGQAGASLSGLTLTAPIDMGGNQINNVAQAVLSSDVPTYGQVQGMLTGVVWKNPAMAVATGSISPLSGLTTTVDGIALNTIDMRVLLTAQTTGAGTNVDNGVWVVKSGAWVRSADVPAGSHAANDACFVEDGTVFAETGWVCTNHTGADTVGTSPLTFVEFTSVAGYSAGSGLSLNGHQFNVNTATSVGTYVYNVGSANEVAVAITATDPGISILSDGLQTLLNSTGGLEHTTNGDEIKLPSTSGLQTTSSGLSVKLPSTSGLQSTSSGLSILNDPNGGLTDSSSGEAIKVDTTTNGFATVAIGANGLTVIGLPSQFDINNTAVSSNVTAANLNTLTNGPGTSGHGDGLHQHMQMRGQWRTVSAVATSQPVYWSTTNSEVDVADASADARSFATGVAVAGASAGAYADVVFSGLAKGILSSATAGQVYYLAPGGGMQTTVPARGNRVEVMGFAVNATDFFVQVRDYGKKL